MYNHCGCIDFDMVRTQTSNARICSRRHWKCYERTTALMEKRMNASLECECLPSCAEISFTTTTADVQLATGSGGFIVSDPNLRQFDLDVRYVVHSFFYVDIFFIYYVANFRSLIIEIKSKLYLCWFTFFRLFLLTLFF